MQHLIMAKPKDGATPDDVLKFLKKFQSWEPPAGVKIEGMWSGGPGGSGAGFAIVSADDFGAILEFCAQTSGIVTQQIYSVAPTTPEDLARQMAGLEWAAS